MRLTIIVIVAILSLASCVSPGTSPPRDMPQLRLAPASYEGTVAMEQRLTFSFAQAGEQARRTEQVDALVEINSDEVRVLVHRLGRPLLRLGWDGYDIDVWRAPGIPDALDGPQVLNDLQLMLWPVHSIQAALPAPWSLATSGTGRHLLHAGIEMVTVTYDGKHDATLENHRYHYRIHVRSTPVTPA